ncbi:MAG: hypothetical protein CVU56_03890 [Deltaproteobacteria bacterium HGW-Deltaproteobacteria-14]|nr:MAG: hypothetical protein CVU56_03890 [Deltaproteobacteria bacterium HGW-Deltaproteobacteria-14]
MRPPPTLGVIGATPRPLPGPLFRATRLQDFERHAGALADAPYLAGHAAAAAFMGGVGRVALAPVPGFDDPVAIAAAATALLEDGATCLVAPGLTGLSGQRALVAAFEAWRDGDDAPDHASGVSLWLDAPATDAAGIAAHRDALSGDRSAVWVVAPSVRALAPGRARADRVPASAVVGALAMGTTGALGALVSLEERAPTEALGTLAGAGGIGLLVPRGPRRLVGLDATPPRVSAAAPDHGGDDDDQPDPIARAIHALTADIVAGVLADDANGPALEREARRVLRRFAASGAITAFAVRYEEGQLLVWYRTPQRVREVRVVTERL